MAIFVGNISIPWKYSDLVASKLDFYVNMKRIPKES